MTRTATLAALALTAGFATASTGPTDAESLKNAEITFRLSENGGPRGDVMLGSVHFTGNLVYDNFIYVNKITDFTYTGPVAGMRIIAGPDTASDAEPAMLMELDGDSSNVSAEDMDEFNELATEAFKNANLNHYVALDKSGTEFSMILELGRELRDNEADWDPVPELLYFERGSGGGNSVLTVEAVDKDGNTVGVPIVIAPEDGVHTEPTRSDVALVNTDGSYKGYQTMTCVGLDLSTLGVTRASRLRLRTSRIGDTHTDGSPFSTGEAQPDFKLMLVQTVRVAIPAAYIGD